MLICCIPFFLFFSFEDDLDDDADDEPLDEPIESQQVSHMITLINPFALRKSKIVYNFGLSECNRVMENKDGAVVSQGVSFREKFFNTF